VDDTPHHWFSREILVHERALMRFLRRVWPDPSEIDDLCQETYVRVYEAGLKERPAAPQAFLFATARHLMADRVRRGKIVSIELKSDLDSLNVLIDEASPEARLSARQDLWRLGKVFERLSPISQDVVWMRKVENLSQREVARRLGLTTKSVQNRIARGIRIMQEAYYGSQALNESAGESHFGSESEHG